MIVNGPIVAARKDDGYRLPENCLANDQIGVPRQLKDKGRPAAPFKILWDWSRAQCATSAHTRRLVR